MLEHYMLKSSAWRSLSLVGRAAYIEIAQRYAPGNNGRIAMSGRMLADSLPISRATSLRALEELVEHGFIEPVKGGAFNIKSGDRRATEWRITTYKCDATGQPPTRRFMHWQAGKNYFTASPEGHTGLTREPPGSTKQ